MANHIQIRVTDFESDNPMPMAFPEDVTLDDIKKAATTMVEEGSVRAAAVINTSSGATLWSARWTLTVNPNGE